MYWLSQFPRAQKIGCSAGLSAIDGQMSTIGITVDNVLIVTVSPGTEICTTCPGAPEGEGPRTFSDSSNSLKWPYFENNSPKWRNLAKRDANSVYITANLHKKFIKLVVDNLTLRTTPTQKHTTSSTKLPELYHYLFRHYLFKNCCKSSQNSA